MSIKNCIHITLLEKNLRYATAYCTYSRTVTYSPLVVRIRFRLFPSFIVTKLDFNKKNKIYNILLLFFDSQITGNSQHI